MIVEDEDRRHSKKWKIKDKKNREKEITITSATSDKEQKLLFLGKWEDKMQTDQSWDVAYSLKL